MADLTLTPKLPLDGLDKTIGACRLRECDLALYALAIPQGGDAACAKAVKKVLGLTLPDANICSVSGENWAARTGQDQVMLILQEPLDAGKIAALQDAVYVTLQTDAWVACELSGSGALAALERLCPIDLDPSVFAVGAFARTVMEHMGVAVLRTGPESYLLLSASSSARSFAHALEQSMSYTAA